MPNSDRYRGDNPDLLKQIQDLRRRVSALERLPRLGNSSIGTGGTFRVYDDNGDTRVELGLLPDGTYGLRVKELADGDFVGMPLIYSAFVGTSEEATNTSLVDLATPGPTLDVNVGGSGRLLILASANVSLSHSASGAGVSAQAAMAAWLSGTNTYQPSAAASNGWGAFTHSATVSTGTIALGNSGPLVIASLLEGLDPGLTTVTMKYARQGGTANRVVFFFNRSLTVIRL